LLFLLSLFHFSREARFILGRELGRFGLRRRLRLGRRRFYAGGGGYFARGLADGLRGGSEQSFFLRGVFRLSFLGLLLWLFGLLGILRLLCLLLCHVDYYASGWPPENTRRCML